MLDIRMVREKPEIVKKDLRKRGEREKLEWVDTLLEADRAWRKGLKAIEHLRHQRNVLTRQIAELKRNRKDASGLIQEMRTIPEKIKSLEEENHNHQEKIRFYLMRLPNLLHTSVPVGKDEHDNKIIRKVGSPPKFSFKAKNHLELLEGLGLIDW